MTRRPLGHVIILFAVALLGCQGRPVPSANTHPPSAYRLEIEPSSTRVGDLVTLRFPEDPTATGGVLSILRAQSGGSWKDVYALFSTARGSGEPTYKPITPGQEIPVIGIGLVGPVTVKIPPVVPGPYRVARGYGLTQGNKTGSQVTAYGAVIVKP